MNFGEALKSSEGAGEMIQSAQHCVKVPGIAACACNPRPGEADSGGSLGQSDKPV